MVLKYKYIELTTCRSFQCPVSDVQLASILMSDVRRLESQSGGGYSITLIFVNLQERLECVILDGL